MYTKVIIVFLLVLFVMHCIVSYLHRRHYAVCRIPLRRLLLACFAQVEDEMKPGDLLAFRGEDWFSAFLRKAGQAPISHTAIVYRRTPKGLTLMEAECLGVREVLIADSVRKYGGEVWWLPMTATARDRLNEKAMQTYLRQAKKQNVTARRVISRALHMVYAGVNNLLDHRSGTKQSKPKDDLPFCSELVAGALQAGGMAICLSNPDRLTISKRLLDPAIVVPLDLLSQRIWSSTYFQLKGPTITYLTCCS